jgi:putative NADH-flavin reductase
MRLAVFGGTGRVGRHVVNQALAQGHEIAALVRQAEELPPDGGVRYVAGDATDPVAVESVIRGADAVLSSLGAPSLEMPGSVLSDGMRTIVSAMARTGTPRVVAVAGSGILDDPRGGLRHDQPEFPAIFRAISQEHAGTWAALRRSSVDWTLVCTTTQVQGAQPGRLRARADVLPDGGAEISIEDIAGFMLGQLNDTTFLNRRVGLTW